MTLLGGILAALGRSRRVPRRGFNVLTSKQGPRTFYKGKGAAPTGKHTSKGGYQILQEKLPDYVVPDLKGFNLKPYVAYDTATLKK